jgi:hypothetical protein
MEVLSAQTPPQKHRHGREGNTTGRELKKHNKNPAPLAVYTRSLGSSQADPGIPPDPEL